MTNENMVLVCGAMRALRVLFEMVASNCREQKASATINRHHHCGEVSERLKELASKASVGEILPWVRIPPSPPIFRLYFHSVNRSLG